MASPYFKGPKPRFGGKAASLAANENPPKAAVKKVKVRAHYRVVPTPKNTARLEPATEHGSSKRFYKPLHPGQKPSGYEPVGRRPGRAGIGSPVTSRPYWLATRGPTGDTASQLSAAQLVKAQQAGTHPTVAAKALAAAVHPLTDLSRQATGEKPFKLGGAASDAANIAANLISPEKVAAAAGVFGLRGLRTARVAKEAVAAAKPRVFPVAQSYEGGPFHPVDALGDYHELMPKGQHLYHSTNADLLQRIREEGLKPGKTRPNETTGVYFAEEGTGITSLRPTHARKGDVVLRAKRSDVPSEVTDMFKPGSGFAEHVARDPVRPEHLEYLGADNRWHPLVGDSHAALTKDAAALRGAVSGQPARAALKGLTASEKAAAKLDNPNAGKSVRQLQREQKILYSQERAKRAAAAEAHLNNQALPPDERLRLAKHELKGELPKVHFQGFTELSDEAITAMQKHILDHPHLMPFQKITASSALANALTGKLPTPSELTLLEHVFGRDTTNSLGAIAKHPFKDTVLSVLNVPRSLMSSFDLSAPFRQGLVVSTRHPKIFAQNFGPMVKAFGSERFYNATLDDIKARPTYPMMLQAKLGLTDLGHAVGGREERFASDVAEKLTGGRRSPVRASGRAYTGFLDKTRADVFDHLVQRASSQGVNVQDEKFLKGLGSYVNAATGRGDLGAFQEAGKVMNAAFFSPRLMASRLNIIFAPVKYRNADPFVRKEAIRSMVQLAGTVSTLLALASQAPGVKVVTDPRNPDWGKIKLGNTRIDIGGGFQQYLRLFAQLATGVAISSTSGKKLNLTAGGFGQPNRLDLFLRFFEGKESPIASFVTDYLRNSDQVGNKFSLRTEVTSRMLPLLAQDSYDLYKERHGGLNGLAAAFAGYGVGAVGFGMQTYGPTAPAVLTKKPQSYFGSSSGGAGSPYFGSPSSSGGGGGYFATP